MMNKPFGKTIRQEVISHAALKLRIWRREDQPAKTWDAVEAVIDGSRKGTLGGMMKDYVVGLSDSACRRLECAIEREAK
jgi:hypothetical protein